MDLVGVRADTAPFSSVAQQALRVATRLQRAMGLKEQGPAQVAEVADHRLRAYNKLLEVYESIQRAVAFLRGARYDADDIVPNLHPGRPGRSRGDADTQVPPGTVAPGGSGTPGTASAAGTDGGGGGPALWLPADNLVTHGVVVGMTGSGKTGLLTVLVEEAARARVPVGGAPRLRGDDARRGQRLSRAD